jgi:ABC-type sugar transport system ATPase subunit
MSEAGAYLRIEGLGIRYGAVDAVRDAALSLRQGEFLVLLGPSGCGKSSILKALAGLIAADRGTLWLNGARLDTLPAHRRDIGLVFQNYALFPHMTVAANVRFGLDMRGVGRREAAGRVAAALALVRLAEVEGRLPAQLSGGQQQRVALARALVINPRLLLLDEPLSNLDATLRAEMRFELRDLHRRAGLTTIMVTHDQVEAMAMADRIAVMRGGTIEQVGTPAEIYEQPGTGFVATFVGTPPAALLPVTVAGDGAVRIGGAAWSPPPRLAATLARNAPAEALLCLRPERAAITTPGSPGALAAEVIGSEYLGADRLIHVRIGSAPAILRTSTAQAHDGHIAIAIPDDAPLFDGAGRYRLR